MRVMLRFLQVSLLFLPVSLLARMPSEDPANAWKSVLAPAVVSCLEQRIPDSSFEAEVTWIPAQLARNPVHEAFGILCQHNEEIPSGLRQFELFIEDNTSQRYPVQVRLTARLLMPVPRQAIPRGKTIRAADITKEWVHIASSSPKYVTHSEDLMGNVARRNLPAMMPVASTHVHAKYIVETGDTLEMIYSQNGIEIAITVTARQNGAPGETIRLQAEQTRRLYEGTLTSDGNARWVRTL